MKTINVKIFPNSRKLLVEVDGDLYKVYVNAPAVDGKANRALIEVLAHFFKVKKSDIDIIKGEKSRNKIVRVTGII